MSNLMKEIEQCRAEMIELSYSYPLTADVVVQTSMRLDELINEYQFQQTTANAS